MSPQIIKTDRRRNFLVEQLREQEDSAWERIRGMWKSKRINPLAYQRKLRKEAERHAR